jgi:TRAP-type mannitol/chloroaromatic compound transport system substrate-binding protein
MTSPKVQRRQFLQAAGVGLAASTVAAPAIAQTMPELRWRMTTSFPRSLDTLHGGADAIARAVAEATDNRFQIQVYAAGEIVPPFQAADAVQSGTVEMCETASYYFLGKDLAFALPCAVPFGPNARMQNAWQYHHGGLELMNEFYKRYNIHAFPCGNTGCQMAGWFRKEIKEVADLNGLKFRIGGFGGRVLGKLGVVAQQVPAGEIIPSLEKGAIDAAEWIGPYDDEKLGFHKVAPFYYYPGWWEGATQVHLFINLPPNYKSIIRNAADMTNVWMSSRYDALNPAALKRLLLAGAQLRPFPQPVLEACLKAANEVYAEISAGNAEFKKIWDHIVAFRNDQYLWWQVAEYTYDTFMIRSRPRAG